MANGYIAFDLDGTLAEYNGWPGNPEHIGKPVPAMVAKVRAYLDAGIEVRVMMARVSEQAGPDRLKIAAVIQDWTQRHIGERLPVTASKDFHMICLYDDRVIAVERNTGRVLGGEEPDVKIEK